MFADPLDVADHIDAWLDGRHWLNVWLGTTVENQEMADKRIAELLKIPAKVRFLSCEPLAHVADICIKKLSDETAIWSSCSNVEGEGFSVTLGDCRRAKAALEGGAK
jgi:protein gp37